MTANDKARETMSRLALEFPGDPLFSLYIKGIRKRGEVVPGLGPNVPRGARSAADSTSGRQVEIPTAEANVGSAPLGLKNRQINFDPGTLANGQLRETMSRLALEFPGDRLFSLYIKGIRKRAKQCSVRGRKEAA